MNTSVANPKVKRLIHTLLLWMPLWIGTTVLFGLMGLVYALVLKQDQWLSSQALLVREEANGATLRLGRFDSETQMKAAQETILEVARHHQVVADALKAVGPRPSWISFWSTQNWPSKGLVEATANSQISMRAPKGAEFGATEVIYLDVKQPSPDRALLFCRTLCDSLEIRLQQVRKDKADSIISELTHARDSARVQLKSVTEQLQKFERIAGVELSDLRGMTDMIAGGGNSRIQLDQLKAEIRSAETAHQELLDDLKLLQDAISDPSSLVVAPTAVVTTQPGLKRLREGYAEAQLSASQLSGRFTEEHPLLVAARTTQDSIRSRLVNELKASLASLEQEIKTSNLKIARLRTTQSDTERKLSGLAENRAEYANVISEVKTRSAILEVAERELAEAEASSEASSSTSLISRMEQPVVSERPVGPGKLTITGGCTMAGLLFGLGLVFVFSPNENGKSFGRRITDLGRRREDQNPPSDRNERTPDHEGGNGEVATPASSTESNVYEASPSVKNVPAKRLERTLCSDHLEKRREKPAPILYDETNLPRVVEPTTSIERSIVPTADLQSSSSEFVDVATSALPMQHESLADIDYTMPNTDEHPKDSSFRDFLIAELNKSNERRQQPRAAEAKPAKASLSLRPANPKT